MTKLPIVEKFDVLEINDLKVNFGTACPCVILFSMSTNTSAISLASSS